MHNKIRSLLVAKNNTILAGSVFSIFQLKFNILNQNYIFNNFCFVKGY